MKSFSYETKVELYETDASGVIFFSHLFHFTHRALSAFFNELGVSLQDRFTKQDYFFPVVHAEGDYLAPIFTEDLLHIDVQVISIGNTSFALAYTLKKNGVCVAQAKTIHVAVDSTKSKVEIPSHLRKRMESFLNT